MRQVKILFAAFFLFQILFAGCASAPGKKDSVPYSKQIEQEREKKAFLIQAAIGFVGLAGGGAMGILSAEEGEDAVVPALTGALVGGAIGFGVGFFMSENYRESAEDEEEIRKPSDEKMEEYFDEYEKIQLMQ